MLKGSKRIEFGMIKYKIVKLRNKIFLIIFMESMREKSH